MKYQSCFVVIAFALTSTLLLGCESKVKRDFKAGCQAGGLDRSTCSCIYDKVEEHYSPEFMQKMSDVTVRESMQPPEGFNVVMANAVQQCQK